MDFKMFCERSMYRHYAKKDPKTGRVEVTQLDYVDKLWATVRDFRSPSPLSPDLSPA
ncbi:hypothetical protein FRC10_004442 [Ceratobasidium sp. 414]|nr:hypothetical protein FRC10_004442 [Ceratobasidium sp. 414]